MTLMTYITANAILASSVVYGIVRLLGHGVLSDRAARGPRTADLTALPVHERDRLAA